MDLRENIQKVRAEIDAAAMAVGRDPASIELLAATKTQTSDTIRSAIAAGITLCGENRVQELTAHLADRAYDGARVHFIGHLQTNKVKYVVGKVELIHSVSSDKLLRAIDAQADKLGVTQDILLEVNLAGEESKSGFTPQEAAGAAKLAVSRCLFALAATVATRDLATRYSRDTSFIPLLSIKTRMPKAPVATSPPRQSKMGTMSRIVNTIERTVMPSA